MKYTFSFKEINIGCVAIESDHMPSRAEIIEAINSGNADYRKTEYEEIRFAEIGRATRQSERNQER